MRLFSSGWSFLSVAVLVLGLVVVVSGSAPTASAQACAKDSTVYPNVTGTLCTAGVASIPPTVPQPPRIIIDNGPLTTCPLNYNGDTGVTSYGVCDQTTGTPLVPVGPPASMQISAPQLPPALYPVDMSSLPGVVYPAAPYYLPPALPPGYTYDPSQLYGVPDSGAPSSDGYVCFPC